MTKNPKSV